MSRLRQYLREHPPSRVAWRAGGMALMHLVNGWMSTLNYRSASYSRGTDPTSSDFEGPAIFIFWHEYIPVPLYLRPHCRMAVLLSQHQDAELLSQAAHFAGLETVRGSTHRGATAALKGLMRRAAGRSLVLTPDGPRGPRRRLAAGCIYLSSRLQVPLIPLGVGYDHPWRYRRVWDQFAIPRLFSRARMVSGPRCQIPADLDRVAIEEHRLWMEKLLNQLCDTAERWAANELQLKGEGPLVRAPASREAFSSRREPMSLLVPRPLPSPSPALAPEKTHLNISGR